MKKHYKITSAVLTASLLITPITNVFLQNNNIVKANEVTNSISKVETFSDYDFFKEVEKLYNSGEISKEKFDKVKYLFYQKGWWGENKIVTFHDGAIDVYISGSVMSAIKELGSRGANALISAVPGIGPIISSSNIVGIALSMWNTDNGVILYFKKITEPGYFQGSPTGGYVTKYIYQHYRSQ